MSETQNYTKFLFKSMLKKCGLTMKQAIESYNLLHPDKPTSTQNVSNKLERNTLRFYEMIDLLSAIGIEASFKKIGEQSSTKKEESPTQMEPLKMVDIESPNFGLVMICGHDVVKAAESYKRNLTDDIDKTSEQLLCISVGREFNAIVRPVPTIEKIVEKMPDGETKITTITSTVSIV